MHAPAPEPARQAVDEQAVSRVLGHCHLINNWDGVVNRILKCHRCLRRLPESAFKPLGPRTFRGNKTLFALHPYCHTCRDQSRSKWQKHPLYSPELHRFWSKYLGGLHGGAIKRSIHFSLEADDLLEKYLDQEGCCAMTGIRMEPFAEASSLKGRKRPNAPSVDRIDSKKHYTPDNIQIVMTAVNMMKGDLPNQVFIELCHQISIKNLV